MSAWTYALIVAAMVAAAALSIRRSDIDRDPLYRLTPLQYSVSVLAWALIGIPCLLLAGALAALARFAFWLAYAVRQCCREVDVRLVPALPQAHTLDFPRHASLAHRVISSSHQPPSIMKFSDLPTLGSDFEGGAFAGVCTRPDGVHVAVALLPAAPADRLNWDAAQDWAKAQQGELPTRPVAAMLFATLRDRFEPVWYWTSETHEDDGSYAWGQYFSYGNQLDYGKSVKARARAVRLIPLTA